MTTGVSTIKDIAKRARVSTATVSRTINETGAVSEGTRRKVLRAVQKLHYYPNAHARSLALGRSDQIGLLVSDIANPFFPELVKAIAPHWSYISEDGLPPIDSILAMHDYWADYFTYVENKATRSQLFDLTVARDAKRRLDAEKPFGK